MAAATKHAKPAITLPLANAKIATAKAITMAGTRFHQGRFRFTTLTMFPTYPFSTLFKSLLTNSYAPGVIAAVDYVGTRMRV
jgi:hypothetical protein